MSGSGINFGNRHHPEYYGSLRSVARLGMVAFAIAALSWGIIFQYYYNARLPIGIPVDRLTALADTAAFSTLLTLVCILCGAFTPLWRAFVRFIYAPTLGHIITALGDPTYGPTPEMGTWAYTRTRLALAVFCAATFAGLGYLDHDIKQTDRQFTPAILVGTLALLGSFFYLSASLTSVIFAAARRLWFGKGWLFNEQKGEWEQVVGRDSYGYIVDARTHSERRVNALNVAKERRSELIQASICSGLSALLLWDCYKHGLGRLHSVFGKGNFSVVAIGFILFIAGWLAIAGLFTVLSKSIAELAYQLHFGHMHGAKVTDPPTRARPGREAVEGEKGHGNAKPAPQSDVGKALGGKKDKNANLRFRN